MGHEPCASRGECYHSKNGRIGGRVAGRKAVESGQLAKISTPESRAKGGRIVGRRNVESGLLDRIHRLGGRVQGPVQGRKNVESGHLARIARLGGQAQGRENVKTGQIQKLGRSGMGGRAGGPTRGRLTGPINIRKLQDPERKGHIYVYDCADGTIKIGFTGGQDAVRTGVRRRYPGGQVLYVVPDVKQSDEWAIHDALRAMHPQETVQKERYRLSLDTILNIIQNDKQATNL